MGGGGGGATRKGKNRGQIIQLQVHEELQKQPHLVLFVSFCSFLLPFLSFFLSFFFFFFLRDDASD